MSRNSGGRTYTFHIVLLAEYVDSRFRGNDKSSDRGGRRRREVEEQVLPFVGGLREGFEGQPLR